jgi:1-acyl-sn-glycerol-3-phosphate acyltransferase
VLPWRDPEVETRVARLELPFNEQGFDPYGVSRRDLVWSFSLLGWLYKRYFDVHVSGIEHVPVRGRAMLIGNHSGGVALDGAMVLCSMLFEMDPPRLAHAMVEKFLNRVPFAAKYTWRCGQVTGLPEHAERLLRDDRLLMVFPEGARGTAKLFWERDSLVKFGSGFLRLALTTRTPIVPFAFVGGGEAIPTVFNLYKLGKLVGAPYIPVTPWLVPLPRPTDVRILYGEAIVPSSLGCREDDDDTVIEASVEAVRERVAALIARGRKERDG